MSWGTVGIALLGYLAVLVVVSLVRAAPVHSVAVQRLRAFFPSWRFFDDVGHVPVLLVRTGAAEDALGPWQRVLGTTTRRWNALILNPEANLLLAYGSLLSQLVDDIDELPDTGDVEDLVSYELTHRLVRARQHMAGGVFYQFRVALVDAAVAADREPTDDDDVLVSQVYEA